MNKPFFSELLNVNTKSELYNRWIEYLLNITEDDIKDIINQGLTYQADALYSMIKEISAGQPRQVRLIRKIVRIKELANDRANTIR